MPLFERTTGGDVKDVRLSLGALFFSLKLTVGVGLLDQIGPWSLPGYVKDVECPFYCCSICKQHSKLLEPGRSLKAGI